MDRELVGGLRAAHDRWPHYVKAHRFSLALAMGLFWADYQHLTVDHLYTCPKNCVNPRHLRPASNKQQQENLVGAYKSNKSSGIRGVSWYPKLGKWFAYVDHNKRRYNLGYFDDIARGRRCGHR